MRDAVREGHYHVARALHAAGGELQFDEATASAQLCELAKQGLAERLVLLLQCGCDINAKDYDSRTCLHLAASMGNLPIVERLVTMGAHVNAKDRWDGTPLRDAVRVGHAEVARVLRLAGGLLGFNEVDTSSQLCELARCGSVEKLTVMLACDSRVNAVDYDGRTCMHLAGCTGVVPMVEKLLEAHADVNLRDRWNNTPLVDAIKHGHMGVARLLKSKGAELPYDEVTTSSELCELARAGSVDMIKSMLECNASINASDYDQRTCLHLASSEVRSCAFLVARVTILLTHAILSCHAQGNLAVVVVLIDAAADVNAKDRWGGTPLRDAVRQGHMEVARKLREHGGEMGFAEVEASGQLCELARAGSLDLLAMMLRCGVQVNAVDYDRRTCLHLASSEVTSTYAVHICSAHMQWTYAVHICGAHRGPCRPRGHP